MNLAVVISSCDKYSFLWEKWWHYFNKNFGLDYPVYFLNEKKDVPFPVKQIKVDIPEKELWTKKLRESLKQVPEDNIFLLLDDLFPISRLNLQNIFHTFTTINADSMQIRRVKSKYQSVYPTMFKINGTTVNKLTDESRYLTAFSPSIWKKSFLLECIKYDESPQQCELKNRMKKKGCNVYSYLKPNWYTDVSRKGKLTDKGKKLLR